MSKIPQCPQCNSNYVYQDRDLYICPECANEWSVHTDLQSEVQGRIYKDVNGVELADGDDVIVIKDLKVKGSSGIVKQGTKVKNIRLVDNDHDIDCRVDGIGSISIKTEFVKKA